MLKDLNAISWRKISKKPENKLKNMKMKIIISKNKSKHSK